MHQQSSHPRSLRGRGVAAGLAGALVATSLLVALPARGGVAIPVDCSTDTTVLRMDGVAYDLEGPCGVVKILADDAEVSMPTATDLVIRGHGNVVVAKPLTRVVVRGHHNRVSTPSARSLRIASPGSSVVVSGLLEKAVLDRRGATVRADQVTVLRIDGNGHRVRARRGYHARLEGNRNDLDYHRLGRLVVNGDHNEALVRRGRTAVRVDGDRNRIRVNRRA